MDIRELRLLFRDLGEMVNDSKLKQIIEKYDADHDGTINLDEFCTLMVGLAKEEQNTQVRCVCPSSCLLRRLSLGALASPKIYGCILKSSESLP